MKDITKHPEYFSPYVVFKNEIFRRFDKKHEISNYGRIRTIGKRKKFHNSVVCERKARILKPNQNKDGYIYISSRYKPHILVLETFVCQRPYKKCVNHKDGNKLNNHISNLEWVTWSENMKHAWANGLNKGSAKLTIGQVKFIRYAVKTKLCKQVDLARRFDVNSCTIGDIVHYRNWKNI